MSVKIYNGYRREFKSLNDLNQFLDWWRLDARKLYIEQYAKLLANETVRIIDKNSFISQGILSGEITNHPFYAAMKNLQTLYSDTKYPNPYYNLECDLCIFLRDDYTYFMIYSCKREYEELFQKGQGVEYFGYWDNTDPQDGVSEKEWNNRYLVWERIVPSFVPSRHSLLLNIVGNKIHPIELDLEPFDYMPYIPSKKTRVEILSSKLPKEQIVKFEDLLPIISPKDFH